MIAGALIRRLSLRSRFEVRVPLSHSAGPVVAGAVAAGAVLALHALGLHDAIALGAALLSYLVVLKLWLVATSQSLALRDFTT